MKLLDGEDGIFAREAEGFFFSNWLPPDPKHRPYFLWPPFQWKERIAIYRFEIVISQQQSISLMKFIAQWDNMASAHVRTTIYKESWEKLFTLKDVLHLKTKFFIPPPQPLQTP